MFQTEPILFLQSFSNELLDLFFIAVTSMGERESVAFFTIAVIFGIDLRKGFVLLHMVFWTAFATGWAKDFFALPRPFHIDAAVRAIGKDIAPTPFKGTGAETFWSLPGKTAIEFARWYRTGSFGFPSGHTSGAVALWGGLAVLFCKKWVCLTCGLLMVMVPFSRLYLGRHFIADILGGYLLGAAILGFIFWIAFTRPAVKKFLFSRGTLSSEASKTEARFSAGYLFGLPILIMLLFSSHITYPAMLLGLNMGFFLVSLRRVPDDSGSIPHRIMRVCIAGIIFLMTEYVLGLLLHLLPRPFPVITSVVWPVCMMAAFVWAAVETNVRLGLMKRLE